MKAISLWQPWALAVVLGAKRFETRHWKTGVRGPVLIHAAKRWTSLQSDMLGAFIEADALPANVEIHRGKILGRIEIIGMKRTEEYEVGEPDRRRIISYQEEILGDWSKGRWAWEFWNPIAFRTAIPFRGSQGFFEVPDELIPRS